MNKNQEIKQKLNFSQVFIILGVLFVIFLVISGITAYLTDTQTIENHFTVGQVKIELLENKWNALTASNENGIPDVAENLTPNQKIDKDPVIHNIGKNDAFVYLKIKVPIAKFSKNDQTKQELFLYEINDQWTILDARTIQYENYIEKVYYYNVNNGILSPTQSTTSLFKNDKIKFANISSGVADLQNLELEVTAYAVQSSNLPEGKNTVQTAYSLYDEN